MFERLLKRVEYLDKRPLKSTTKHQTPMSRGVIREEEKRKINPHVSHGRANGLKGSMDKIFQKMSGERSILRQVKLLHKTVQRLV